MPSKKPAEKGSKPSRSARSAGNAGSSVSARHARPRSETRAEERAEPRASPHGDKLREAAEREAPARGRNQPARSRKAVNAAANAAMGVSRRAIRATPIIVRKAASILEEEVAMGIGAVKRIEQRFIDVAALRAQPPDAVMSRFRRDAHEAVDIILDIVTAAATTVGERAGRFVNITASGSQFTTTSASTPGSGEPGVRLTIVRVNGKVKPGAVGELTMSLENESDQATVEFTLHVAELVNTSGERIASSQVTFSPSTLSVGPRESGQVTVRVAVPKGTPAGIYEGLVRATQLDGLRALLSVEVG